MTIIIDSAEKVYDGWVGDYLKGEHIIKVIMVDNENVGDYTNDKFEWVVEHKKGDDWLSSLMDGRLYTQMAKMAKYFPTQYKEIIFEGDWDQLVSKTAARYGGTPQGKGMIANLIASRYKCHLFGIQFFNTWSAKETATELKRIDKYASNFDGFEVKMQLTNAPRACNDKRVRIMLNFDHIGSIGKIKLILKRFKSLNSFVQACINEPKQTIKKLKGTKVGKKTVYGIKDLFESEQKVEEVDKHNGIQKSDE
jgi:ERCC4-type nuclease